MTTTHAERQRAYRQQHLKAVEGARSRINSSVASRAKLALERLAQHCGVTQAQLLERLVMEEQARLLATLPSARQEAYYEGSAHETEKIVRQRRTVSE
jgi:hypothetical protein